MKKPLLNPYLLSFILFTALSLSSCKNTTESVNKESLDSIQTQKIISLDGTLTEILAEFGLLNQVVATDITSTYPKDAHHIKKLGHNRSLSIEAVLAEEPTLIIGKQDKTVTSLSNDQVSQLKQTGINTAFFNQTYSVNGTKKLIADMGDEFKVPTTKVKAIQSNIDKYLDSIKPVEKKKKVLFIYARTNTMMVSGKNTAINNIIELAGAKNAVQAFDGFKPFNTESVIEANPDVILMFTTGFDSMNGKDGLFETQGLSETNAGKNKRVIALDGLYISGFGPRLGQAALELHREIYQNN